MWREENGGIAQCPVGGGGGGGSRGNKTFIHHIRAHPRVCSRASQILERGGESAHFKVNMYAHALIRASFGFVGLCLVAFVQQSASGSKTTQGRSVSTSPSCVCVCVSSLFIKLRVCGGNADGA